MRSFEKALQHYNERIRLGSDTALNALVSMGIITRYLGRGGDLEYFKRALDLWEHARKKRIQSPAALLENKALALICLGQYEGAISTLYDAIEKMIPGDQFEFYRYELLIESPNPPEGIVEMLDIFRRANEKS